jgi:predicted transcriptional regulator
MNTDRSKMSADQLREMAAALMKQAEDQRTREFESTMNFLSDKLAHMGKTKRDAVLHLIKMMRSHEAEATLAELASRAPRTRRNKERAELDSEGNRSAT